MIGAVDESAVVSCSRCESVEMIVIPRGDGPPALWCADCEEPVEYEGGSA